MRDASPETTRLSVQNAADHYDCSVATIRRRIADGTLRAERFGPRLLRVIVKLEG